MSSTKSLESQSLVSVVTPFHNTADYLANAIESVLAQSYSRFEYILSDNCSTDGSAEIAADYARRDNRIRLVRQKHLVSQVQHYNSALTEISASSQYCKLVQADDSIFPECLQSMIQAFAQSDSIGLVSSYWLKGSILRGSGFPYRSPLLRGKEMARLYLRAGIYVFGSPTAVMYRSAVVRKHQPFYDESALHEDTDKCMQILRHWDFGFVYQVLSFSRADNESISSAVRIFQPDALDRYILIQRYAPVFLEAGEAMALSRQSKRQYYSVLAGESFRFPRRAFWQYHESGLKTLGTTLDFPYLALQIGRELLWLAANPGAAVGRGLRYFRRSLKQGRPPGTDFAHETASVTSASELK